MAADALSGLPLADGDEPVARARRFAPPPGSSPQGALDMISRRRCCASVRATARRRRWTRSPGKALCAAPGEIATGRIGYGSRRRCCASVRATARRRRWARSPGKALAPPPGKARRGLFAQQPLQARLTPAIDPFAKNKQTQPFNHQQRSPDDRHPCGPVALCAAQPVQQRQQNANDDGHRQ